MEKKITPSEDKRNVHLTRKYPTRKGWKWRRCTCKLCEKQGKNKTISFNTRLAHLEASHIEEYKITDNIDQFFERIKE